MHVLFFIESIGLWLINVRENRRDNQELTIKRNTQHWVHKTQDEEKQSKNHNLICVVHHYTQLIFIKYFVYRCA
jgi:hypothetical protein